MPRCILDESWDPKKPFQAQERERKVGGICVDVWNGSKWVMPSNGLDGCPSWSMVSSFCRILRGEKQWILDVFETRTIACGGELGVLSF